MKNLSIVLSLILLQPLALSAKMIPGEVISHGAPPQTLTWSEITSRKINNPAEPYDVPFRSPKKERTKVPSHFHKSVAPSAPLGNAFTASDWSGFQGDEYNTNLWTPPDSNGAIGPNHFVEIINGGVSIYDRSGTQISTTPLTSFFTFTHDTVSYPRNYAFDPRVIYDHRSERWFTTCLEFNNGVENHVLLAVSRSSDPTGTWDRYVIPVGVPSNGDNYFSDYETLAVDDNGVYIGLSVFPIIAPAFGKIVATPKAPLISATPSLGTVTQWSNISDMYSTPQPAFNHDSISSTDRAWFVSSSPSDLANIQYRRLVWNSGTPLLDAASSTLATPYYGNVINAPALGSTTNVNTGDDRIQMAMIKNNRLWTTRNVGVNSSGGSTGADRVGCEWFEIDVSTATPSLLQNGRVYDPSASDPRFYYYPSIAANTAGTAVMGFSGSNSSEYIGAYSTSRVSSDATGTMGTIVQLQPGLASFTRLDGRNRNRWGDYSYTSIDPLDENSFWTIQEYVKGVNNWGLYIAHTTSTPPTASAPWPMFLPAILNNAAEKRN